MGAEDPDLTKGRGGPQRSHFAKLATTEFVHNHFGLIQYRERLKVRKDAFFELIPNEDSITDN